MRRIAALLACAALASGCGGSDDELQQVGTSAGLTRYEVASHGFSIGVPPKWRVVSVEEALPEAEEERIARENPEFAPLLEGVSSGEGPIKLFAFDPAVHERFATNVNVVAVGLPANATLEQFIRVNENQIKTFGGRASGVESKPARLPAGPARRLAYRLRLTTEGRERTVATLQYLLIGGGNGYVVTFSTLPELSDRYAPTFERTVRSLRLR
jgi:hypothetical protein